MDGCIVNCVQLCQRDQAERKPLGQWAFCPSPHTHAWWSGDGLGRLFLWWSLISVFPSLSDLGEGVKLISLVWSDRFSSAFPLWFWSAYILKWFSFISISLWGDTLFTFRDQWIMCVSLVKAGLLQTSMPTKCLHQPVLCQMLKSRAQCCL